MSGDAPQAYPSWRTNAAKSGSIAAAMVVAMLAVGGAGLPDLVIGIPPFMLMVYIILSGRNASRARRDEEEADLDAVEDRIDQCRELLAQAGRLAREEPGGQRVDLTLAQLFATARLISSRYGRYLSKEGMWALQEIEKMIIDAKFPVEGGLEGLVEALGGQIDAVSAGVLGINDPRLRAPREAL